VGDGDPIAATYVSGGAGNKGAGAQQGAKVRAVELLDAHLVLAYDPRTTLHMIRE
jgi:hypothetical protein